VPHPLGSSARTLAAAPDCADSHWNTSAAAVAVRHRRRLSAVEELPGAALGGEEAVGAAYCRTRALR
jgi:hypothetical protein